MAGFVVLVDEEAEEEPDYGCAAAEEDTVVFDAGGRVSGLSFWVISKWMGGLT